MGGLTSEQIAEVLGAHVKTVRFCICRIKKQTGYDIKYLKGKINHRLYTALMEGGLEKFTVRQISDLFGVSRGLVYDYIYLIRDKTGCAVKYRKEKEK